MDTAFFRLLCVETDNEDMEINSYSENARNLWVTANARLQPLDRRQATARLSSATVSAT